jgi:hypothetical protein
LNWLSNTVATLSALLKSRAALQLENVALRHQIGGPAAFGKEAPAVE